MKTAILTSLLLVAGLVPASLHSARTQTQNPNEVLKEGSDMPSDLTELMEPGREFAPDMPDEPQLRIAKESLQAIADKETEWKAAADRLDKAVDAQSGHFNLFIEAVTAKALEEYAIKLKASGIELMNAYAELAKKNVELKGNITRGPTILKEVAELYRKYAEEEKFQDVKEQYQKLEQIWRARAALMEKRGGSLDGFNDPTFYAYLKSWDRFLGVFIPTIKNYGVNDGPYMEEFERFKNKLAAHIKRVNALSEAITKWKDAALKQSENETIQEEQRQKAARIQEEQRQISARIQEEQRQENERQLKIAARIQEEQRQENRRLLELALDGKAYPISRTSAKTEFEINSMPSWKNFPVGETVLIGRLNLSKKELEYVARALVFREGRDLRITENDYEFEYGDVVIMPDAILPSDISCGPELREAQSVVNSNYELVKRAKNPRGSLRERIGPPELRRQLAERFRPPAPLEDEYASN